MWERQAGKTSRANINGVKNIKGEMLRAELWSHFWPNCDGRDLGHFFGVLAELL